MLSLLARVQKTISIDAVFASITTINTITIFSGKLQYFMYILAGQGQGSGLELTEMPAGSRSGSINTLCSTVSDGQMKP